MKIIADFTRKLVSLQAQSEPKGTARIYGIAPYQIGTKENPIKNARVTLYEDSIFDTEIGTTTIK